MFPYTHTLRECFSYKLTSSLCFLFGNNHHIYKVKERVAQSCPTLCDPMDYTVPGILQARTLEWVGFSLPQGIFPTQGSKPGLDMLSSHTAQHLDITTLSLNFSSCPLFLPCYIFKCSFNCNCH